jgi:hypothetical protein
MARQRSGNKFYFTQETEQAIIDFNASEDPIKRNRIYNEHIRAAFEKLVESLYHTFKFYYIDMPVEDIKHEAIALLNEKITKFTFGKGKAYSYFTRVTINHFIAKNKDAYAKLKQYESTEAIDENRNVIGEVVYSDYQESLRDFTEQFVTYYDNNLNRIFNSKKDIIVADSVIELFRIRENIEIFNKKALYILIRERTGLETQNITKVINVIKKDFLTKFQHYQRTGIFKAL